MTGYGLACTSFASIKYTVEIKSLNSKFLELSLKLPRALSDKEFALRNACNKQLERGKVNLTIHAEYADATAKAATINQDLLASYYNKLKSIADQLGDADAGLFQLALNFPSVIQYETEASSEEEWQQV